jgi:hypothetical protein
MNKIILHTEPNHYFTGPRICILTGHSDAQLPLALKTVYSVLCNYAIEWGNDLFILRGDMEGYFPIYRLQEAIKILNQNKYDWIFVVGADVLITNFKTSLASLTDDEAHLVISTDSNGLNADSFLLRNTTKGIGFAQNIIDRFDEFKNSTFKEQDGITKIAMELPGVVKVLPQRAMNSYNYDLYVARAGRNGVDILGNSGQWQPGDFLIHWAGLPLEVRIFEAKKMMDKVQP